MRLTVQKTNKIMRLRSFNGFMGLMAFIGLLVASIVMLVEKSPHETINYWIVVSICSLMYVSSFLFEFFCLRRVIKELDDLTQNIKSMEEQTGISLEQVDGTYYITAISDILNQSLMNLDEKNMKLESELQRNQRLSESISDFYHQIKTLKDTGFKIDFFEYDYNNRIFIFITGLLTLLENAGDVLEITTDDLFERFAFSISTGEFDQLVDRCISDNIPLDFEFSVSPGKEEIRWMRFWGRLSSDQTRITGAITDITREVMERNLEKERAVRDNMTGFYNRNALSEVAGKALTECREGEMVAFIYIGLTGYQEFQERFGMMAGNSYIRASAEMLRKFMTPSLIPFRWLGADFLVLATGVKSPKQFRKDAIQIIQKVKKYVGEVEGIPVSFPVAVGYAISGIDGDVPADLLEYASFAEHEVLRGEQENPNPFNRERYDEAKRASLRRTFIKDIIDRNQLNIVFQPIISLKTGDLYGFEALSRPTNPIYRNIEELIQDAEATGHYTILEKRMVYNALDAYMMRDERFRDHYLFINTAPFATLEEQDYNDIRNRYFGHMNVVFEVIERNRMDPDEINLRKSIVVKAGAKFALDDFGSGYSNHLALLALEPDIIKIDKELIRGIGTDLRKQHMLEDIISYARYRGTRVLAEGVETKEELETLCRLGVDYAQGYFIGIPQSELSGPSEQALEVIRSMGKSNAIRIDNIITIVKESMALLDGEMAENALMTAFLVMKIALKLKVKGEKLAGLITSAILHDMGAMYGEYGDWRNLGRQKLPGHSLFAYLIMKEYFPYEQCPEVVLYHHHPWSERNTVIENTSIPEEANFISLADSVAGLVLDNPDWCDNEEELLEKLRELDHDPGIISLFAELCRAGILREVASGDYIENLMNVSKRLQAGKSEVEGVIRTFVYSAIFRLPNAYSHARVMEVIARFLARLTKQNWKLVESIGQASLIYNLGRLPMPGREPESAENAYEENLIIRGRLKTIARIMKKAEMDDIMNLMYAASGGEELSPENRVIISKDVVVGARILNISDIFTSLLEDRPNRPALNCIEAVYELASLVKPESGYLSLAETMQDYIDDIEGRVQTAKAEIDKRYRSIMDTCGKVLGR